MHILGLGLAGACIIGRQILDTGLPLLPITYLLLRPGLGGATLCCGAPGNSAVIGQTTN